MGAVSCLLPIRLPKDDTPLRIDEMDTSAVPSACVVSLSRKKEDIFVYCDAFADAGGTACPAAGRGPASSSLGVQRTLAAGLRCDSR